MALTQRDTVDLLQLLRGFIRYDAIAKVSEESGWLPHRAVPFDKYLQEADGDTADFRDKVTAFYAGNDALITQDMRARLSAYLVDEEAKETLEEALRAHQHGLYRACCRVLLPEVERVLLQDWLGNPATRPLTANDIIARAKKAYLEDFVLDDSHQLVLFGKLMEHLFVKFEGRQTTGDSTPNRHAATHAWIPYSSKMQSLNTIILADYIFSLVTSFKQKRTRQGKKQGNGSP